MDKAWHTLSLFLLVLVCAGLHLNTAIAMADAHNSCKSECELLNWTDWTCSECKDTTSSTERAAFRYRAICCHDNKPDACLSKCDQRSESLFELGNCTQHCLSAYLYEPDSVHTEHVTRMTSHEITTGVSVMTVSGDVQTENVVFTRTSRPIPSKTPATIESSTIHTSRQSPVRAISSIMHQSRTSPDNTKASTMHIARESSTKKITRGTNTSKHEQDPLVSIRTTTHEHLLPTDQSPDNVLVTAASLPFTIDSGPLGKRSETTTGDLLTTSSELQRHSTLHKNNARTKQTTGIHGDKTFFKQASEFPSTSSMYAGSGASPVTRMHASDQTGGTSSKNGSAIVTAAVPACVCTALLLAILTAMLVYFKRRRRAADTRQSTV